MTDEERTRNLVLIAILLVLFLALLAWNPAHGQTRRTHRTTTTERVTRYERPAWVTPAATPRPTATRPAVRSIPLATVTPASRSN